MIAMLILMIATVVHVQHTFKPDQVSQVMASLSNQSYCMLAGWTQSSIHQS